MSAVVVNTGSGGGGTSSGGGNGKGKKQDWLTTAALLGGVAVVGYIGSLMLSKKLGINVGKQTLPTDVDSLLAPPPSSTTPDQLAALPPTPQAPGATSYYPPLQVPSGAVGPTPTPYQLDPYLGLTNTIPFYGNPPPAGNLYGPQYPNLNTLYPYQLPVAQTVTNAYRGETKHRWHGGDAHNPWSGPNMGFANKQHGEYEHGHRHGSEHDHNKNYEEIGDEYLTDTEDLELSVEEPYLHEIYGVNSENADMGDFDVLAMSESDECMSDEEMDVHVHSKETDYNSGEWGYAGHGHRHKHGKDDKENRHSEDKREHHYHKDTYGMGNNFKTRIVRDHQGRLVGLSSHDLVT